MSVFLDEVKEEFSFKKSDIFLQPKDFNDFKGLLPFLTFFILCPMPPIPGDLDTAFLLPIVTKYL